ncbi:MAG: MFS transporter [Acidimicrobiia bacterium]|jgi:MFS family permease
MTSQIDTSRKRSLTVIWLYSLLTTIAWAALFPVLPLFVTGPLGGSDIAVGIVMSGALIAAALLQPIVGGIADQRGRRLLLVGGPILFGIAISLFTLADTPAKLMGLRAVAAIGDAAFIIGALTVVSDLAPEGKRGEAYSIFSLSTWAGMGLGPTIGDFVLRAHSFETVWIVCAAFSAAGAATALALPETRRRSAQPRSASSLLSRAAALPGLVLALEIFGFTALLVYAPLYALELGMAGAGLVMLVNAAVLVAIRVFGRRLPDRLGARDASSVGLAFAALGFALPAVFPHPIALYAGAASFGIGHALLYPALFVLAVNRASADERSAAVGSLKAGESIGMASGVAVLGVVASLWGYGAVFGIAAATTLCGLVLLRTAGAAGSSPDSHEQSAAIESRRGHAAGRRPRTRAKRLGN